MNGAVTDSFGRRQTWAFLAACAAAGALAVPLNPIATPLAAAVTGLLAWLGLSLWSWSRLPSWMQIRDPGRFPPPVRSALALALGLAVGLVLLGVLRLGIEPSLPAIGARIAAAGTLPIWRRLLIIYVAAVSEELFFRLLLLSAIAGLGVRILRSRESVAPASVIWVANVLAALAFAGVHLPGWMQAAPMSAALAASVLALNAAGGIVFGWVFANRGILLAMLTHAGADCAIQLVGPLTR